MPSARSGPEPVASSTAVVPQPSGTAPRQAALPGCGSLLVVAVALYCAAHTSLGGEAIVRCAGKLGSRAAPYLVGIVRASNDRHVQLVAVAERHSMQPAATVAIVDALLEEDRSDQRGALFYALGIVGCRAAIDEAGVVAATSAADPRRRCIALDTLSRVARREVAIPRLIAALDDNQRSVRSTAVGGLGYCGDAAAPALPALRTLATGPDAELRAACVESIRLIASGDRCTDSAAGI